MSLARVKSALAAVAVAVADVVVVAAADTVAAAAAVVVAIAISQPVFKVGVRFSRASAVFLVLQQPVGFNGQEFSQPESDCW